MVCLRFFTTGLPLSALKTGVPRVWAHMHLGRGGGGGRYRKEQELQNSSKLTKLKRRARGPTQYLASVTSKALLASVDQPWAPRKTLRSKISAMNPLEKGRLKSLSGRLLLSSNSTCKTKNENWTRNVNNHVPLFKVQFRRYLHFII